MRLYLYSLKGDKRYLNKYPFLTSLGGSGDSHDYSGEYYFEAKMMDDTSVVDPTFILSYEHYWRSWVNRQMCNYLWCQDTERWYFVNDVTMSQGKVYVKCHVDVLMTYRKEIAAKKAIIKRTNSTSKITRMNRYNQYLVDDKYKSYAPEVAWVKEFPKNMGFQNDTTHFVMCVVGNTEGSNNRSEGGEVNAGSER